MLRILLSGKHVFDQIVIAYGLIVITAIAIVTLIATISYLEAWLKQMGSK